MMMTYDYDQQNNIKNFFLKLTEPVGPSTGIEFRNHDDYDYDDDIAIFIFEFFVVVVIL
jgi:hypothetical protein